MTGEDFHAQGPSYRQAREILARNCEVPPSLEVFEHELQVKRNGRDGNRAQPNLTAPEFARHLSDNYHRVPGWQDGDE